VITNFERYQIRRAAGMVLRAMGSRPARIGCWLGIAAGVTWWLAGSAASSEDRAWYLADEMDEMRDRLYPRDGDVEGVAA
jgi:hypothetical protein